jgi:Double zinc ribbon
MQHYDEPTRNEQRPEDASTGTPAEAAEEFETPAWPSQDTGAPDDEAPGSATEPAAMPAEAVEVAPEPATPTAQPSDVEAMAGASGPPPGEAEAHPGPIGGTETQPAHSVPPMEPGESTQCPRCGTENRPGVAFCRNCGQRLVAAGAPATVERPRPPEGTQQCPRCGTYNRTGVAFCQNCGANLRAAAAAAGYVPPAVGPAPAAAAAATAEEEREGAMLGPIVLLIAAIGIATGWLLPFPFGTGTSLWDRAFGADGYGVAFWSGYEGISGLVAQAYYGFAAPAPILVAILILLALGGLVRARAGPLQLIGLLITLVWGIGLAALFVVVEVVQGPGGDLVNILRNLTPGGIIFLLASLIAIIGTLTRFARA